MFGIKKTLPLWRRRRSSFLNLERALSGMARTFAHSDLAYAVLTEKAASRRVAVAKQRFMRRADIR